MQPSLRLSAPAGFFPGADSAAVQALFALRSEGPGDAVAFREAVEALAQQTLAQRGFVLEEFVAALAALPMSFVELYELYIGKNVLNRFRQDHGYKDGTYQKVWFGREDNEHLVEVIGSLDVGMTDYVSRVYEALDARYPESP